MKLPSLTFWLNQIKAKEYFRGLEDGKTDGYLKGYSSGVEFGLIDGYKEGFERALTVSKETLCKERYRPVSVVDTEIVLGELEKS